MKRVFNILLTFYSHNLISLVGKQLKKEFLFNTMKKKQSLKTFFEKFKGKISLTMDLWTSCQNLPFLCVTAHFIDDN